MSLPIRDSAVMNGSEDFAPCFEEEPAVKSALLPGRFCASLFIRT